MGSCYIGIIQISGIVEISYCHFGGDLHENGGMLFSHYNKNKVEELLKGGEMSTLSCDVGSTDFYNDNIGTKIFDSLDKAMKDFKKNRNIDYIYLFSVKDNKWFVDYNYFKKFDLKDLENELTRHEKRKKIDIKHKKLIQQNLY